jgi:drug/metabolite transporter (DMT)-like permease
MKKKRNIWLLYALTTTVFWGVWGAFTEKSAYNGTVIYIIWSVIMLIPALIALNNINWKPETDKKSILYGLIIGFLGAGGQLVLFTGAIANGPAFLIFPIISLSPVLTILLSIIFLREKASVRGWIGIILALIAIPFLSYQDPDNHFAKGFLWLVFALLVFAAWGLQAFFMKFANNRMKAESIFFYMTLTGLALAPVALFMTDGSDLQNISWNLKDIGLTALVQILNAIGALTIVYAFRYGKAIIVSPLTNAVAPVITVVISLILYNTIPHLLIITGMVLAILSMFVLAFEDS